MKKIKRIYFYSVPDKKKTKNKQDKQTKQKKETKKYMGNIGNNTGVEQHEGETLTGYRTCQFRLIGAQTCI